MKRIRILMIFSWIFSYPCWSQSSLNPYDDSIDSLYWEIEHCDSILCHSKKKDEISKIQVQLINNLRNLTQLLIENNNRSEENIITLNSKVKLYDCLLISDTTVFSMDLPDEKTVPFCLKEHIHIVKLIQELQSNISKVESDINKTKEVIKDLPVDENKTIRKLIEKDVLMIDHQISDLEKVDLRSLSDEQKYYFKPYLTERYNNFLKYFEQ